MTDFMEHHVICPFYKACEKGCGQVIRCEGIVDGCTTVLSFRSRKTYDLHVSRYCRSMEYVSCPVAVEIGKKYEGGA